MIPIVYKNYQSVLFIVVTHPPGPGSGIAFVVIQFFERSILPCQGFIAHEELSIMCMIPIVYKNYQSLLFLAVTHPLGPDSGIPFFAIQFLG
jgi:hypothetical protein